MLSFCFSFRSFATLTIGFLSVGCSIFGGGGQDVVTVQMPFAYGYTALCTQGAGGDYSHQYTSTKYDIDFDTPNGTDDYVYAPIGGTVYTHDSGKEGFGVHVNIDMHDNTYIILAHLKSVLVEDGEEVAKGQLIAVEGTTGSSSGDHIHMGRHDGDASIDGVNGVSIEGLLIEAYDSTSNSFDSYLTSEFVCDLSTGHYYQSRMETPVWHPDGTLVMTPSSNNVYLLDNGYKHLIEDESVFWSYNWDFSQVIYIDETELSCYLTGADYEDDTQITAVYDDGVVWLLVGAQDGEDYLRYRVDSSHWQAILKSWGVNASTYDDLSTNTDLFSYYYESSKSAQLREGSLVTETSSSAVYVATEDAAYPVSDWDTYLALGFWSREIIVVDDGAVRDIQGAVGDCNGAFGCISYSDLLYCGGDPWDGDDDSGSHEDTDDHEDTSEDTGGDHGGADNVPDDLNEGLSWIRTDGASIGLRVGDVFNSSVNGNDVVATGVGVDSSWGYGSSNLTDYDDATDMSWFDLSQGWYRMTMRTNSEWAMYNDYCQSSSKASDLCHKNSDGSYALCFEVQNNEVDLLSFSECSSLE